MSCAFVKCYINKCSFKTATFCSLIISLQLIHLINRLFVLGGFAPGPSLLLLHNHTVHTKGVHHSPDIHSVSQHTVYTFVCYLCAITIISLSNIDTNAMWSIVTCRGLNALWHDHQEIMGDHSLLALFLSVALNLVRLYAMTVWSFCYALILSFNVFNSWLSSLHCMLPLNKF